MGERSKEFKDPKTIVEGISYCGGNFGVWLVGFHLVGFFFSFFNITHNNRRLVLLLILFLLHVSECKYNRTVSGKEQIKYKETPD